MMVMVVMVMVMVTRRRRGDYLVLDPDNLAASCPFIDHLRCPCMVQRGAPAVSCPFMDHLRCPCVVQATFDPAVFVIKKHLVTAFCEEMRAVISEIQRRSMTVANA